MKGWLWKHWRKITLLLAIAGLVVLYLSCVKSLWTRNPLFNPDSPKNYDQTFYIRYADAISHHEPGLLPRSRMPLYPWIMHFFTDPSRDIVERLPSYIRLNVTISVLCLFAVYFMLRGPLGRRLAALTTVAVAFRVFLFKAVLVQPELLFYTLYFGLFLLMLHLLKKPSARLMAAGGVLAGLAQLTKGSTLSLVGLFLAAAFVSEIIRWWRGGGARGLLRPLAFVAGFLLIAGVFLRNSWREYGSPFYDPNTRYYFWAESPQEMFALQRLGLANGKPSFDHSNIDDPLVTQFLPKWCPDAALRKEIVDGAKQGKVLFAEGRYDVLPTAHRWWAEHTVSVFVDRIVEGLFRGRDASDHSGGPAKRMGKRETIRNYHLLHMPTFGLGDSMLAHNRDHPNGYWDFLRYFFGAAVVSVLLALFFSWRGVWEGVRANWLAILFAVSAIVITALAYAWWGTISVGNRYFLSLYLPTMCCFGTVIRYCCSLIPVQMTVVWHRRTFTLTPFAIFILSLVVFSVDDLNDPLNRRNLPAPNQLERQIVQ